MNRLEAVRCFCIAAEVLNFREAASRLAVSPSVVTRLISELEGALGEALFVRNTRHIRLSDFGERFLPRAQLWLDDGVALFQGARTADEMAGVVRITVPAWRESDAVLADLLEALAPYPDLVIDWREDMHRLDSVAHAIDIGLRIAQAPQPHFIVRPICEVGDTLVAAPALIERLGMPVDVEDLCRRYPFAVPINPATGRPWAMALDAHTPLRPRHVVLYALTPYATLQAALQGRAVDFASELLCRAHVRAGRLRPLLPDIPVQKWQLFLYRPYQAMTPARVLAVFDVLEGILRRHFAAVGLEEGVL